MRPSRLRLGTRGSPLARAQSGWVADRLCGLHPGLEVELVSIQTSGDRFSLGPEPDSQAPGAPNVKAMFVKEIEEALLSGSVDFAVHSAKDLPAELPPGLGLAAVPRREDPRDALISQTPWKDLPRGAVVGTASLRRRIQLAAARPDLAFEPLRGNVDTRLRKLKEGRVGALVLAAAGLKRLGLDSVPREPLPEDLVVPAPGQGALALEARLDRREVLELLAGLEDPQARIELELERALLAELGGGCSTPLGALARARGGEVSLSVFWSDPQGRRTRRASERSDLAGRFALARRLAARLR